MQNLFKGKLMARLHEQIIDRARPKRETGAPNKRMRNHLKDFMRESMLKPTPNQAPTCHKKRM